MVVQESLTYRTQGHGSIELTDDVARIVSRCGVQQGLCHVFVHHTSASLMLCENADPTVLRDLEAFMARLVPDGDPLFRHTTEGPDDMPAHVRLGSEAQAQTEAARAAIASFRALGGGWDARHASSNNFGLAMTAI